MVAMFTVVSAALLAQAQEGVRPSAPEKSVNDSKKMVITQGRADAPPGGLSASSLGSDQNSFRKAPKHFLLDQKTLWTSPAKARVPEATWLVPLGGLAAGFLATDT